MTAPVFTLNLQTSITGDGASPLIDNLTPVGTPLPVNQPTCPITNPTSPGIFQRIPIGLNADDLQAQVLIPAGTRYLILQRADRTPLNMTWQQTSTDVGVQLHKTVACPLVWALPMNSPPTSTWFTITAYSSLPVYCDLWLL